MQSIELYSSYSMYVPEGRALIYKSSNGENYSWSTSYRIKQSIGHNEVLIKTISGALNPLDYKIPVIYPFWLVFKGKPVGQDVCGKVLAVGSSVTAFKEGDIVFGHGPCCCEFSVAAAAELAIVPLTVRDPSVFGGLCAAGVTALQMLRKGGCFEGNSPKTIMIIGPSGGVGSCAVQIANSLCPIGTRIIGVCSARSAEYVKSIGVDTVVDYSVENFQFHACVPEKCLDAIIDCVSSPDDYNYVPEGMKLIRENTGRYIASNTVNALEWARCMLGTFSGFRLFRGQYELIMVQPNTKDLDQVASMVQEGKLALNVDATLPFTSEAIKEGLSRLSERHVRGKLIISM